MTDEIDIFFRIAARLAISNFDGASSDLRMKKILRSLADRNLIVLALRALESVKVVAGTVWLYSNQNRLCSAFGAVWSNNRIGTHGRRREF